MRLLSLLLVLSLVSPCLAQDREEPNHLRMGVQAGGFYRLGGVRPHQTEGYGMATLDVWGYRGEDENLSWGLGLHGAFSDDGGPRFAPTVFLNFPKDGSMGFRRLSAGAYVLGISRNIDNYPHNMVRVDFPGFYAEAEYGFNDWFSLVGQAEFLPTSIYSQDFFENNEGESFGSDQIRNYWLGGKLGKTPGITTILVSAAVLGLLASAPLNFN